MLDELDNRITRAAGFAEWLMRPVFVLLRLCLVVWMYVLLIMFWGLVIGFPLFLIWDILHRS